MAQARYYKLEWVSCRNSTEFPAMTRFNLFVGAVRNAASSMDVDSTTETDGGEASNLNDNSTATEFFNFEYTPPGETVTIKVDMGASPPAIDGYNFTTFGGGSDRDIDKWILTASDDDVTYYTIDDRSAAQDITTLRLTDTATYSIDTDVGGSGTSIPVIMNQLRQQGIS